MKFCKNGTTTSTKIIMCNILPSMLGIFVLGLGISAEGLKYAYVVPQRKTIYSLEDAIIDIPYLAFPFIIPFLVPLPVWMCPSPSIFPAITCCTSSGTV